jgi:hypothetical protein
MKKSDMIVGSVILLILLVALPQNACVQAGWASHRIRPGMSVQEALQVSGDWTWAGAHSDRPAPEPALRLSFNRRLISHGDERQQFASLDEIAQALDQRMTGHPWRMWLIYSGIPRASFGVLFNAQGRVDHVSDLATAD